MRTEKNFEGEKRGENRVKMSSMFIYIQTYNFVYEVGIVFHS